MKASYYDFILKRFSVRHYLAVDPESGKSAARDILSDFPEQGSIDVIFSINDGGGYEIVEALERAGRNEIFFASVDGDPRAVEKIKQNSILKIDSAQFCSELGAEAIKAAYMILINHQIGKKILLPVFPITRDTVHKYSGWTGPRPGPFKKTWSSPKPEWTGEIRYLDE